MDSNMPISFNEVSSSGHPNSDGDHETDTSNKSPEYIQLDSDSDASIEHNSNTVKESNDKQENLELKDKSNFFSMENTSSKALSKEDIIVEVNKSMESNDVVITQKSDGVCSQALNKDLAVENHDDFLEKRDKIVQKEVVSDQSGNDAETGIGSEVEEYRPPPGEKLENITLICDKIKKAGFEITPVLHQLLYAHAKQGTRFLDLETMKKEILVFNGYPQNMSPSKRSANRNYLLNLSENNFVSICNILHIKENGKKSDNIEKIMEFLHFPQPSEQIKVSSLNKPPKNQNSRRTGKKKTQKGKSEDDKDLCLPSTSKNHQQSVSGVQDIMSISELNVSSIKIKPPIFDALKDKETPSEIEHAGGSIQKQQSGISKSSQNKTKFGCHQKKNVVMKNHKNSPKPLKKKLGEIPSIKDKIMSSDQRLLQIMNRIIFGVPGEPDKVKENLLEFSGFVHLNEQTKIGKPSYMLSLKESDLKHIAVTLNLVSEGTQQEIIQRIWGFLRLPNDRQYLIKKKGNGNETEENVLNKAPKRDVSTIGKREEKKEQGTLSNNEDQSFNVKVEKNKRNKRKGTAECRESERIKKRKLEIEEKNSMQNLNSDGIECPKKQDNDLAEKKIKNLEKSVINFITKVITETVDMRNTTMSMIYNEVYRNFPDDNLRNHKDFIKSVIKWVLIG